MPGPAAASTYFINVSHTVPVISISTDNANLYGATGIFDNVNQDWNKPCYVEYFDAGKNLIFKQAAGIQLDGGAGGSRTQPQHSFRIEPGNGTFGDGDVKYALIPDRPNRNDYSSFYLRNGSNQYNTLQYKDGLQVKAIAKNTYTYYSAHSAIVAYINGAYSGVYELREKLNADFLAENYLMNIDSLDLLTLSYYKGQVLEPIEGSVDGFWEDYSRFLSLTPTSTGFLGEAGKILDLDNYTDYIIAQAWIGNTDWPFNNIRVWRNSSTGFRWQYAVQDVEWSMLPNGWTTATYDMIGYMLGTGTGYPYTGYWNRLMQNSTYKVSFINRFADLMNTNYQFSNLGPMEEEKYSFQYAEMPAEFDRWGNSTMSAYISNHNVLRNQLEIRTGYVRDDILTHFGLTRQVEVTLDVQPQGAGQIKISTIVPVDYPWQGVYFSGNPVKITAMANPGYKFKNWSTNSLISNPGNATFTANLSDATEGFTANFEASNANFQGVTISEIHYKNGKNEATNDWFELFNGGSSPVNLNGWYFTDNDTAHVFRFGSTATIAANYDWYLEIM
ncbi:MAG: CotH kinase family protein [Bacteroidales bacterium]